MKRVTFPKRVGFHDEIRKRVNKYFETNGISKTADWRMVLKTAVILTWLAVSYVSFLLCASSPILAWVSAIALAQGILLVGFNIMHDGNHGSYSGSPRLNRIIGFTLDLIGGSSLLWRYKAQYSAPHLHQHRRTR